MSLVPRLLLSIKVPSAETLVSLALAEEPGALGSVSEEEESLGRGLGTGGWMGGRGTESRDSLRREGGRAKGFVGRVALRKDFFFFKSKIFKKYLKEEFLLKLGDKKESDRAKIQLVGDQLPATGQPGGAERSEGLALAWRGVLCFEDSC